MINRESRLSAILIVLSAMVMSRSPIHPFPPPPSTVS
jgi:hypothetical protein